MPSRIEFQGIPESFRKNKVQEDGGGLKFTVELTEDQREFWKQLSDLSGKLVKFIAEYD